MTDSEKIRRRQEKLLSMGIKPDSLIGNIKRVEKEMAAFEELLDREEAQ